MRTFAAGGLQRGPRRSQLSNAARPDRRGELAAGLGTIALIAELLAVPVVVPVSLVLFAIGRVSRWRLQWLLVPVLAGVGWLAAADPGQLLSGLTHAPADPFRLLRDPGGAAETALAWLPREIPGALAMGAVQAGLLMWLSLRRRGGSWRPGLIAAARRWRGRALLTSGRTVTGTGCIIGLDPRTGELAGLSWAEAERGVLLTATDSGELGPIAQAVICAAMRRRKTVLVFDFDARRDTATLTEQVAMMASALGIPLWRASQPDVALRAAVGRAIRARSVLLASGPGALLTGEVIGMLAWLRERGLRGDSLLYLSGCEAVERALLTELLEFGPSTGTAMLLSTTSAACAEALAGRVGQALACGPVSRELSASLAPIRVRADGVPGLSGDALTRQLAGEFAVIGADYVRPGCRAVPITALDWLAGTEPRGARLASQVPAGAGSR